MKTILLKYAGIAAIAINLISCSGKNDDNQLVNTTTDATPQSKADSVSQAKAVEIAAKTEKAKLPKPYDEQENAEQKIAELVTKAQKENKNILIQAGGNWCIWCLRFNNFVQTTPELKKIVDDNYLYYHLNYSPANKNEKVFAQYGDPGKEFGYPVFMVLDKNGKLIHTQDSSVLEDGDGYSIEKTKFFFNEWIPKS